MERIIHNAWFEGVAKNIFMMLNLKDLTKCRLVSRSLYGFAENQRFWLKKLISRGLSKKNQKNWIAAIDETKDGTTEKEGTGIFYTCFSKKLFKSCRPTASGTKN